MDYINRTYPLFSACGLNCGLCPRHHTNGSSKCPGCAGDGFSLVHPSCGVLSCSQRKGIEYCFLCEEYPCNKYDGTDLTDSFITHKNQLYDLKKANRMGMETYKIELDEKVEILENLLENYDDGRRKSFYCVAVNLFELQDVRAVMQQIETEINMDMSLKEKAVISVNFIKDMAEKRGISLQLPKKSK